MDLLEKIINIDLYYDFYEHLPRFLIGFLISSEIFVYYCATTQYKLIIQDIINLKLSIAGYIIAFTVLFLVGVLAVEIYGFVFTCIFTTVNLIEKLKIQPLNKFIIKHIETNPLSSHVELFSPELKEIMIDTFSSAFKIKKNIYDMDKFINEYCRINKVFPELRKDDFVFTFYMGLFTNNLLLISIFIYEKQFLIALVFLVWVIYIFNKSIEKIRYISFNRFTAVYLHLILLNKVP